jgi:hypothetical protein
MFIALDLVLSAPLGATFEYLRKIALLKERECKGGIRLL